MVRFDELHISEDKKSLVIECHVEDYSIYSQMYIKSIYLEYYKNRVTGNTPSDKAILVYENTEDYTDVKGVRKHITQDMITQMGIESFDKGMFYVYVTCDGTLPPEAATFGCWADNAFDIGVVVDWQMLYQMGMQYVSSFTCKNPCGLSEEFGQFIIAWHAIKLSIDSCDWLQLEKLWETLVGAGTPVQVGGCNCR